MCEEGLGVVVCSELVRELLQEKADALACGVPPIDRMGHRAGHEGSEEVIDALRVEESRQLREDVWRRDAQGHHGQGYGRSDSIWARNVRRGEDGEIRAVSGQDDVVDREKSHASFGSSGNMAGVDRQHVGGHVGGEIIDHHLQFCGENVGGGLSFDAHEDLEHTTKANERLLMHRILVRLTQDQGTRGLRGCSPRPCLRVPAQQKRSRLPRLGEKWGETSVSGETRGRWIPRWPRRRFVPQRAERRCGGTAALWRSCAWRVRLHIGGGEDHLRIEHGDGERTPGCHPEPWTWG